MDWIWTSILFGALLVAIGSAEFLRKRYQFSIKITRKFIHIITGIFIAVAPLVLFSKIPLLIISGLFILVNIFASKLHWMPGMHATEKVSYGTVFYPISFFILAFFLWQNHKTILVIAILIMAIADAMAAIVGENIKKPIPYQISGELKSFQGSAVMFATTFIITLLGLKLFAQIDNLTVAVTQAIWISGMVAIITTACESISFKGSDNLTVPLGAAFVLHYMITHTQTQNINFTIGLGIALLIASGSYLLHFLSGSGAVSTFLLGTVVFGTGSWEFSLPILLFFILSSLLSKIGKTWKQKFADTFQKGGRRDFGQVLANGGIAGIIIILWNYFPHDMWYFAFVGSIAAVTADTWATEIGVFSKLPPRNILNFKQVKPGTSGGVTVLGFMGALFGSFVIVFFGSLVTTRYDSFSHILPFIAMIIIAGLLGSVVDSIIGATIQSQYQCPNCGKITEKKIHCQNHATKLISGFRFIDNDVVNGMCAFSGGLITWIIYQFYV
jgi:uncharacterized protein (TIGR00297 family)